MIRAANLQNFPFANSIFNRRRKPPLYSRRMSAASASAVGRTDGGRTSILFVCWGNVCRSPACESVFRTRAREANVASRFVVDSAGVDVEAPLLRASSAMRQVTRKRGYQLKTKARRILRTDLNRFDLVVAMDHDVLFELAGIHSKPMATVKLLGEFLPAPMSAGSSVGSATAILAGISTGISTGMPIDVPDPMNAPPETCHHVFDLLEMACAAIIEQVSDLPAITKQT